MKKILLYITLFIGLLSLDACQNEEVVSEMGYLRLDIEANAYVHPKTKIIENYDPKQIAVQIKNAQNEVVESTTDWTSWQNKDISLAPGSYSVVASSNGFDGLESGFDIPYYVGSTQVNISGGTRVTAEVECTLANVKVTVNYDDNFKKAFKNATAKVASVREGVASLDFIMNTTTASGYFPADNLTSTLTVINQSDKEYSQTYEITNVQPRDHYILNYKVAGQGSMGGVDITVDEGETIYTFSVVVPTQATTQLQTNPANAWSNFAYASGVITAFEGTPYDANVHFEYKANNTDTWTRVAAAPNGDNYTATLSDLTPETKYTYRMIYVNGSETFTGNEETFTTEASAQLPNCKFDNWIKSSNTIYPTSEADNTLYGYSYWDTSNPGTTQGLGSLSGVGNTTEGSSEVVDPKKGGMSAKLTSSAAMGKYAAASLYTGSFGGLVNMTDGAFINFGRPFTSRPTQMRGFFKYAPVNIDYRGKNTPEGEGLIGTPDQCAIYIALTTEAITVNNTDVSSFVKWESDTRVIAYGALPASECISTNREWKEFTIDLKYKDLTTKPTHVIAVFTCSRYGDYFTGGKGSQMFVDETELIYGNNPQKQ